MDDQHDKETHKTTSGSAKHSDHHGEPITLPKRPAYRRVKMPDGKWVMITTFPPDWWDGISPRTMPTGKQVGVEITPIRPVPLPDRCDKAMIDAWFTEHFVKHWGMIEGFGTKFIALDGDLLRFQFLVDQRFRLHGNGFLTCMHIAECYARTIPVLAGAKRFQADELHALDLLGFLGSSVTDSVDLEDLTARTRLAWATMPVKPSAIHFGRIRPHEA